jgi:hypothetical protein
MQHWGELNSALELLKQMLLTKYKSNEFQQGYAGNKKMISE